MDMNKHEFFFSVFVCISVYQWLDLSGSETGFGCLF
jgi:hypothetical protein